MNSNSFVRKVALLSVPAEGSVVHIAVIKFVINLDEVLDILF